MTADIFADFSEKYVDYEAFLAAKERVIGRKHKYTAIGTLSEKTIHSVLKYYFEPDEDNHEVALEGYFADIYNDCGVFEIQTRSFNKLREKLAVFLNYYPVTIVYPVCCNKWVSKIDSETGEVSNKRMSPKHLNEYAAFSELYKIKQFLRNDNLKIKLVMLDVDEYKLLKGRSSAKVRAEVKYDSIPIGIRDIISIDCLEDYMQFIPYELEDGFSSGQFAQAAGISAAAAGVVLNILYYTGNVERTGKEGRSYIYRVCS